MGESIDILLNARMLVSDVISGVGQIQKSLQGLTIPKGISDDLEKSFNKLNPLLKDYQKQLSKGFDTKKDLNNFNLLREKVNEVFGEIKSKISEVNGQEIRLKTDVSAITKMEKDLDKATADLQRNLDKLYKNNQSKESISTGFKELEKAIPANFSALAREAKNASEAFKSQNFASANRQLEQMKTHIHDMSSSSKLKLADALGLKDVKGDADKAEIAIKNFFNQLQTNKTSASAIERVNQQIKELVPNIEQAKLDAITSGLKELNSAGTDINNLSDSMRQVGEESERAASGVLEMKDQVAQLKTSTQYFFSLRNMINLLKRGIDDAIQSVKELDAAMTQTAVVTDFNVGDMWERLPEYTANANALGATVKDMYEATTLYYQQGLDTEQSMSIAAETMKMARIGGLEAADATDKMTAALRGFNMELDETSAKRVNDVYSNLAAKTASDTEELGTAMQRTASIAASAGMSFEGTAAFLAQAIETTREPAENLGTAMKTIVARFTELKKNPLEISEVDGEEVDYNKVDTALKSIGVSLKDANGQFRELDQVFLDISQRWDSLSQTQQRYIATTAAGSRQQSRFIAMMSNYERTVQLMDYANNSAGASNEQFGKTMESLEAKLNKLHNAWQQFTMGIANNSMIKGAVDGLTGILNTTNTLIDTLSGGIGPLKSLLSVLTAFTALKAGGRMVNSLIGGLGGLVDPTSSIKEGLKGGFFGGRGQLQAERISNPIIKAIYSLIPHIDKAATQERSYKFQEKGNFNLAREQLRGSLPFQKGSLLSIKNPNTYSFNQITDIFNEQQLNKEQQKNLLKSFPGLKNNISKSLAELFKQAGMSSEVGKGLIQGFRSGNLALDEIMGREELNKNVLERAKEIGGESGKQYKEQFVQQAIAKGRQQGLEGKDLGQFVNQQLKTSFKDAAGDVIRTESPFQKLQDTLGGIGGSLMSAGSGLQMFGAQLSATNPILGQFVSGLGGMLTSIGSLATAIPALMDPFTLGLAAVGTAIYLEQRRIEKVKKTAQDISDSFENVNKTTQDNIATLKGYRDELATLSKGVDINGHNINLSDAEYAKYVEIADNIAEINPEIVRGYNAQGHAIIDNNEALTKTLTLQEQIQKKATKDYISSKSLQKLLDARNIDKDYIAGTAYKTQARGTFVGGEASTIITNSKAPMANAVRDLTKELEGQKGLDIDSILQSYNISLQQLQEGETQAINTFVKNQDKIQAQVNSAISSSGEEANKSLIKSFDTLEEQTAAFDKSVAPVVKNLQTYASNLPAFENIGTEFQAALMSGLKDIAIQPDIDASEMQKQSRLLVQEFDNLAGEGSAYAKAMEEVEIAQDRFAQSLDAAEYTRNTQHALAELDSLMAGRADAYSQAISEYLQTQYDKIKNFTEEGGASLTEAINGMTSTITAAEGAYSSFQESTKTDLSTGKDSMKSIFDEITKETDGVALHMEAFGDGTMWKGARALLGDKFVKENAENVDTIKNEIRSLESELQNGEAGFAAFWENFKQVDDSLIEGFTWNEDGSYDLDRDVNPDAYKQIAEQMHRSEEYVVAMLNAGRQFADIDFSNTDDVRKALSTDQAAIKNGSNIFVKDDYMESALDEAQIYSEKERRDRKAQYEQAGVFTIKTPDVIKAADFTKMGIQDLGSLVRTFGETGQYTKDEIADYAEALSKSKGEIFNAQDFEREYGNFLKEQEDPTLEPIQGIESTVAEIASLLHTDSIKEGKISSEDEQKQKDFHRSLYGDKGVDTELQALGQGQDLNHKILSAGEYKKRFDKFESAQKEAEKWAEIYADGAEQARENEDFDSAKRLQQIADNYVSDASYIKKQVEGSEKAWKEAYARDKALAETGQGPGVQDSDKYKEIYNQALKEAESILDGTYEGTSDGIEKASNDDSNTSAIASRLTKLKQEYGVAVEQGFNSLFKGLDLTQVAQSEEMTNAFLNINEALKTISQGGFNPEELPKPEDFETLGLDNLSQLSQKYNEIFSNIDPNVINTDAAQQTLSQLYQKALSGENLALDSNLMTQMQNLGIDIQKAYEAGLITDPSGLIATANEAGNNTATEGNTAYGEGQADAAANVDTTTSTQSGQNAATKQDKARADGQTKSSTPTPTPTSEPSAPLSSTIQHDQEAGKARTEQLAPQVDTTELEDAKTKAEELTQTLAAGGDYVITVSGADDLIKAADASERVTKNSGNKSVTVSTSFDASAVTSGVSQISGMSTKIQVGANVDPARAAANRVTREIDSKSASIDVSANFTGSWSHDVNITVKKTTVDVNTGGYIIPGGPIYRARGGIASNPMFKRKGTDTIPAMLTPGEYVENREAVDYFGVDFMRKINHKDLAGALQVFGSAAKGRYGQLGPNGKGGLTLTGEEGFEVAWIPSENRSIILGADGPQMANLPSDAIVWNHRQSKKIVKNQSGIGAGSMDGGSYIPSSSTTPSTTTYSSDTYKAVKTTSEAVKKEAEKTAEKLIKVSVWWENIARKTEASQRTMDNALKAFENFTKKITSTLTTTAASDGGGGDAYLKSIGRYQGYNEAQVDRANTELDILDKNSKKTKAQIKAKKAVKEAKKTKSKDDDKKAKKALQKANYNAGAAVQISYEGKDKNNKKTTKEAIVKTSKYIKKDKKTGAYVIDQKKLNTIKDKKKRKAVADALNQEINDKESKKYKAEDNIQKAQEALEKFSEELYNNFFAWEIELTKLRDITQQIEILQSKISRKNAMEGLIEAQVQSRKLSPEEGAAQTLQNFTNRLQQQQETIAKRREAITQSTSDLRNKILGQDLARDIEQLKANKNNATTETQKLGFDKAIEALEEQQKVVVAATQTYGRIVQNSDGTATINFNEDAFKQAQLRGDISEEMGKAIQDFVKEIEEGSKSLDELIQTQTEGLTELYANLNDLNDKWADYESQLIDIEEEANKKELDQIKKLSDSLKKAMDDLLAEVKRRLEERRKIEDNAKTEQDISQKQQRLAALRADTSGGNQVEIARLEKEIADAQQNYQRTLEDQLLEKLQNQADEASRQRERQIELQESIATGVNNIEEVQKWMAAPEDFKDKIWEQYKKANKYDEAVGSAGKAKIASDFATFYQGLLTNRKEQKQLLDTLDSDAIAAEEAKLKQNEGLNNQPSVPLVPSVPSIPSAQTQPASTPTPTPVPEQEKTPPPWVEIYRTISTVSPGDTRGPILPKAKQVAKQYAGNKVASLSNGWDVAINSNGNVIWHDGTGKIAVYDLETGVITHNSYSIDELKKIVSVGNKKTSGEHKNQYPITKGTGYGNSWMEYAEALRHLGGKLADGRWKYYGSFKTGGLASYTGPAWLDGTPSKPELVLNAQDTKNFIALKDVLSRAMGSINSTDNVAYGDITYEININVDHINNDYDVDKITERVKKNIIKDASYRNVTQVRNLR